jgi:drug/metabolite transporter (DMT)-like permease
MNAIHLALTLACVAAVATGQILFKLAARASEGGGPFPWGLFNGWLFAALAVYGTATILWVWVLKTVPLNVAYPFMSLAFVVVPLAAALVLGEATDWRHLAGGALIAAGVAVASWR